MDAVERLVGPARERHGLPMSGTERRAYAVSAAVYAAAAGALAVLLPWDRHASAVTIAGLIVLYAVISRVRFEVGNSTAVATELIFVPMLFLLPLPLVPIAIPSAHVLSRLPSYLSGRTHPDRIFCDVSDGSMALGPVVVLALLAPGGPDLASSGVYALAFAAQIVTDFVPQMLRERIAHHVGVAGTLRMAGYVYRIDAILAPVALMVAIGASQQPEACLAVVPLVLLLHLFARERRDRYTAALELNRAYRGTVMLLSDVVEADDNYTADHSRSVVSLVTAVADELGIDTEARQELEFAALLHDVGKIVIPKEILNKPAALTHEEFELMKTHTIEGQVLLDRVGGMLGRVGKIVRSCHERWDGGGYPDGLAGYEIPLEARIVFACDAYNAMTTDRPYRAAMSRETALEELWGNAGTQFDPRVVSALAQVVRNGGPLEVSPVPAVRSLLESGGAQLPAPRVDARASG